MPAPSRRALLRTLGASAVAPLAGCPIDDATEIAPPGETTDPTPAGTPADAAIGGGPGERPDAVWPLPGRSATNGRSIADGAAFADPPAVDWATDRAELEDDRYDPAFSQPLLADDGVYAVLVHQFGPETAPPERHTLAAFDAEGGRRRWTYAVTDETDEWTPRPTLPALRGDRLFVGAGRTLHAVDRADGTATWTRTFGDAAPTLDLVYATPARTIVTARGLVRALDETGETTWSQELDHRVSTLARGPRHLYVGTGDRQLFALDPSTGDVVWNRTVTAPDEDRMGTAVYAVATAADGLFVQRANGTIYGYGTDGTRVWHDSGRYGGFATDGRRVYVEIDDGGLRALSAATGEVQWSRRLDEIGLGFSARPVVCEDAVYATGVGGSLVAVGTADGSVRWTVDHGLTDVALGTDALYGVGDARVRRLTAPGSGDPGVST